MNFTSHDPEKNKERTFENNYEYRIAEFKANNAYNFWDDEVIEYAIEIKNEIISSLEENSSKSDKIKVNYIKWIEKYIHGIHEFLIEHNFKVPKLLEDRKIFIHQTGKKKVGRPQGLTKRTIDRYKKVFHYFTSLKKKYPSYKKIELYELLASRDFDSKTFTRNTIRNIIEDKKYNLKPDR